VSDRALAVAFFVSLALLFVLAEAPLLGGIFLIAVILTGGMLVVRGLRRGGTLARRMAVTAGVLALLLALSLYGFWLVPLPAVVSVALAARLRRDGERGLLPLVLAGAALALAAAILVLALVA
jgi:hypothetical protein